MPKKQPNTKDNQSLAGLSPQQFLLKFIQKNFERREIDQQSFTIFNKFTAILGRHLDKKTTLSDIEGFVTMVRTVFQNFQFLNKAKRTFCLYVQLLEICLGIFNRAVDMGLSNQICCELLEILWPLYETKRKQEPFTQMQLKFSKIAMPKELTQIETMTKIADFSAVPQLFTPARYQTLMMHTLQAYSQHPMQALLQGFMKMQGSNYSSAIYEVMMNFMEDGDKEKFQKVIKVYVAAGSMKQTTNIIAKLISKNKIQYLYYFLPYIQLEKSNQPSNMFSITLLVLQAILKDRKINEKTMEIIEYISKYTQLLKRAENAGNLENIDRIVQLYNYLVQILFNGKALKDITQEPKVKRKKGNFSQIQNPGSDDEKMIQEVPPKEPTNKKICPLEAEQMKKLSNLMKKIFISFAQNPKMKVVMDTVYTSEEHFNQFVKIVSQSQIQCIPEETVQLILAAYVPLLCQSLQAQKIVKQTCQKQSTFIKVTKLHMLEYMINMEDPSDEDLYNKYYKPIYQRLTDSNGTNFDYLTLTILHEYMSDMKTVLNGLTQDCIQQIDKLKKNRDAHFRCCIALLASILDLRHNIVIKLEYNNIRTQTQKLTLPFQIQDFLTVNQCRQHKSVKSGPRVQLQKQQEEELNIIRAFMQKLLSKIDKLSTLINLRNTEQSSYYYMIIIELCSLCQTIPNFGIQSQEIQSILKMRKNNMYSLTITVSSQIISNLEYFTQNQMVTSINVNQQVQLLHLLIKLEAFVYDGFQGGKLLQEVEKHDTDLTEQRYEEIAIHIRKLLQILGKQPKFQILKIINKSLEQRQTKQNERIPSFEQIEKIKTKLKDYCKSFHIVKLYSEATSNDEILLLMLIKTGIKILDKIWEKIPAAKVENEKKQMRSFRLLYDNKKTRNQAESKTIQAYLKLRLLSLNQQTKNKITIEQIKNITKYLQQNHDQAAKLIVSEQNNENISGIEELFGSKTNFIGYLLEQIMNSQSQSSTDREISLFTLNLLKTLIDNNTSVLDIAKKYTFETLHKSEAIPTLFIKRTKKSVQFLKQLQKTKSTQKIEQSNQSTLKARLCEKQQQKILEESKKIYLILSKMLNSIGNLTSEKQKSIVKMVEDIIELDDYTSIYASVYLVREIINIAPILKFILSKEAFHGLTDRFFSQLMALREIYEDTVIEINPKTGETGFKISSIINFFIDNYYTQNFNENYSFQPSENMVVVHESQKEQKQNKSEIKTKDKKPTLTCQTNQKKNYFKCLNPKCDSYRELCMNCVIVCHKDHPVIYLPSFPNMSRNSKGCQCREETCKINPILEKRKETLQRKKKVMKEPVFYKRIDEGSRAYLEQFGQRGHEYLANMIQDELDDQESFNFMLDGGGGSSNAPLRRQGDPVMHTLYRPELSRGLSPRGYQPGQLAQIAQLGQPNLSNPNQNQPNQPPQPAQPRLFTIPPSIVPQPYSRHMATVPPVYQQPIAANIFSTQLIRQQAEVPRYGLRNTYQFLGGGMSRPLQNEFENLIFIRQERLRQRQRRDREKQRELLRERERQRIKQRDLRSYFNDSRYDFAEYPERFMERQRERQRERIQYVPDNIDNMQDQDPTKDKYLNQDYQATQKSIQNSALQLITKKYQSNKSIYDLTVDQSYLLPIFMNMAVELCQNKTDQSKQKQPLINWHIKLINPIILNPGVIHTSAKMCPPKSFVTRLAKSDGSYHPSPCVSRAPIAVGDKFVFILSGPKFSLHLKQLLYIYLLQKNGTTSTYQATVQQHLQFQPHSISVGFKNMICVAGLHQINIFQYQQNGHIPKGNTPYRHTINNDNINKIKLTKFGVFVGISREVRLLSHTLQIRFMFKMPDALIKQWCIFENGETFTLYVTCSQGYIFYAQGNANSTGEINLIKKINDSRTNRPVGVYVLAKNIQGCGNLMLSTFKDKNIGHSLGRLSGQSTLTDLNYIKLNNQGLDPLVQKHNIMGLSDIAASYNNIEKQQKPKQLFIVSIFKQDKTYDIMGVHKGILGIIRARQDIPNGPTKHEIQFIAEEEKCQYFEIVWFEDRKHWVILSLCEDGGLRLTVPTKFSKGVLEKQAVLLRDKKVSSDRLDNSQKVKIQQPLNSSQKMQENQTQQKLSNSIKQILNIKTIKQSLQNHSKSPHDFLPYLQTSQILRPKQQYSLLNLTSVSEVKCKKFEIKLLNRKKIITGLFLPQCCDVILPTRKVQKTLQVGFTYEEALYFYAFGVVKLEVIKIEEGEYKDIKRTSLLPKSRDMDYQSEQKLFLVGPKNFEVGAYGQLYETIFKPKLPALITKIQKHMNANNPFELTQQQKIEQCLKNCGLLLNNSILSNNGATTFEQTLTFLQTLRECLIVNKNRQALCNRLYPHVKKCIYKSLLLQQTINQRKAHVFNDVHHPLRFATQKKIQLLYDCLNKGQINDEDLILLVNQLYGFVSGSQQDDVGAVNEQPEVDVFMYYVAKYPVMLMKISKKIKVIQNAKMLYRMIPLYIYTYICSKFLGYHVEWLLPALYEAAGKMIIETNDSKSPLKPSILGRFILYKYLKNAQEVKLEAWLRNVQGTDVNQVMKEVPVLNHANSINNSGNLGGRGGFGLGGLGGLGGLADIGLYDGDLEDEEAMFKRAIEESERELARANQMIEQMQPQIQGEKLMEEQFSQFRNTHPFIKDLIQDTLKQIDYTTKNLQNNCQKATVLYVVFKLALNSLENSQQSTRDTFEFLCNSIEKVIQKLCTSYQEITNPNTHGILMLWLNLFGLIFKECYRDTKAIKSYEKAKEDIMNALSTKFKIENIKKLTHVPNLFSRRIKGHKVSTKAHFIYSFISVLQRPCEANFVLLTLGCYWLFPHDEKYYNKDKYIKTIRENQRIGDINKIYETAISNIQIWKEIGNPDWLEKWIEDEKENWTKAMELLALYYE